MCDVSFENNTRTHYIAVIDGVAIEFSTAMNKISYGDRDALSEYVDRVKQNLNAGLPLAPLCTQMNGVNMLRLLEALFSTETIESWLLYASENLSISTINAFTAFFGFKHNATRYPSEFGAKLVKLALEKRNVLFAEEKRKVSAAMLEKKRILSRDQSLQNIVSKIDKDIFVVNKWIIERYAYSRNVVLYRINGHQFSFCLTNHSSLSTVQKITELLSELDDALNSKNCTKIRSVIKSMGGKAAFQIVGTFFGEAAKSFFQAAFTSYTLSKREHPTPCSYLKSYFGGSCNLKYPFYVELLDSLEGCIPQIEKELVDSSSSEIYKKTNEWRLFYFKRHQLCRNIIRFSDSASIQEEIQQYFIYLYNQLSVSGEEPVPFINSYNQSICRVIEKVNRPISSVLELSIWDYRNVVSSLSKEVKLPTVRKIMFHMRGLLAYLAPETVGMVIPLSIIPSQSLNPNRPVSSSVIKQIADHSSDLSPYVWIAFQVFALTGARASSVFDLTVDDLVNIGGKTVAHIYYNKAAARNTESATPSYVPQDISDVAQELYQYIEETSYLRSLLPTPYIFVYASSMFRQESLRKPKVLTSGAFCTEIKNLCAKYGIYNEDGSVPNPTAQGIRAEVGRALFAKGASPETVAGKLHNTASVAKRHYDSMYPADEAAMRRELYSKTVDSAVDSSEAEETYPFAKNNPMYGSCKSSDMCWHGNDCRNCSERIQKKQKEV